MAEPPEGFITPPPGLLPEAQREVREATDSGTRKVTRSAPVFFVRPPGTAPPAAAPPAAAPLAVRWLLRTAEGVEHPVSGLGLIVGRNPRPPDGWESAAVLALADPERSVSKTHAALRIEQGELYVFDLSSTNGTTVAFPDGSDMRVESGVGTAVPSGSTIGFGSNPMLAIRS